MKVEQVTRRFGGERRLLGRGKPAVHAVQGVSLKIRRGETLGIVGESGCGKSTLARMLVGLDRQSSGEILLNGQGIRGLRGRERVRLARRVQYVFQDPLSSLNPRKTIRQILEAPLRNLLSMRRADREARLQELMEAVRLRPEFLERYPHEFSGGQAQRIGIARALAASAELIVLDEPVSSLDVSVQAQVLTLLRELKARFDLTYVFISHDLAVVEAVSDRVAVMYFGLIVEEGEAGALFRRPAHPYTRLLLSAAPVPGRKSMISEEEIAELPDPLAPPPGCAFAPRCARASELCRAERPPLSHGDGKSFACHHPLVDENGSPNG
ncbi:MAG: ATP-binding cassette domain-containing protein [Gammaproteobacteria bacterium]|nr:ATP-binding cassette domain-containing protein [Gammaproteobacteria bacterium]NIU05526.1 ATP-binding cassette domain-containing protein [Gammaproteobacteria bacterium]NIX86799.1 ATP-binding cassette domain-containing protein [Gammaproteobacteria bacterium]